MKKIIFFAAMFCSAVLMCRGQEVKSDVSNWAENYFLNGIEVEPYYKTNPRDEILYLPDIGVELAWKSEVGELYVLKQADFTVTNVFTDGTSEKHQQRAWAVDRVYGISELGWEDEPLILAIAENGKYVLEVKSSDISVRARILWDDKVILERKWSVKLLR